jgi:hypothetical protein
MVEAWTTVAVVGLTAAGLAACDEARSHVLLGQLYEASRDCLDPTSSIAVVDGPDPGFGCDPTCVATPLGQNGSAAGVYVTTMCGPYPPSYEEVDGAPDNITTLAGCAGAFGALARGDTCSADGTSTNPSDAASASDAVFDDAPIAR